MLVIDFYDKKKFEISLIIVNISVNSLYKYGFYNKITHEVDYYGIIQHNYEDGAFVLIQKTLNHYWKSNIGIDLINYKLKDFYINISVNRNKYIETFKFKRKKNQYSIFSTYKEEILFDLGIIDYDDNTLKLFTNIFNIIKEDKKREQKRELMMNHFLFQSLFDIA